MAGGDSRAAGQDNQVGWTRPPSPSSAYPGPMPQLHWGWGRATVGKTSSPSSVVRAVPGHDRRHFITYIFTTSSQTNASDIPASPLLAWFSPTKKRWR